MVGVVVLGDTGALEDGDATVVVVEGLVAREGEESSSCGRAPPLGACEGGVAGWTVESKLVGERGGVTMGTGVGTGTASVAAVAVRAGAPGRGAASVAASGVLALSAVGNQCWCPCKRSTYDCPTS